MIKKGKGTIRVIPETDALRVIGIDTQFTTQLKQLDTILLVGPQAHGDKAQVIQVISDTELIIKNEFKSLGDLSTEQGSLYKCMPHVEQDAVYKAVHEELLNGGCITIFPEGGSHDRVEMLPLKGKFTKTIYIHLCSYVFLLF